MVVVTETKIAVNLDVKNEGSVFVFGQGFLDNLFHDLSLTFIKFHYFTAN